MQPRRGPERVAGAERPGSPRGTTDSETAFLWLLNRMQDYGLSRLSPARDLNPVVELVHDSIQELIQISMRAGAVDTPTLNFMLSDGEQVGEQPLLDRKGVTDCMVCGTSRCPSADDDYKAVVVASEPITDEDWNEVPEGTVIGASPQMRTLSKSLVRPDSLIS